MRRAPATRLSLLKVTCALAVAGALLPVFSHAGQARQLEPAASGRPLPVGFDVLDSLINGVSIRQRTLAGPTNVSGTISSNTTWTLANSPYVVTGNVTVAAGVTLTVDAGVVVKFNNPFRQLTVNGTLRSLGTSASHVTFTSYKDDSVGGDTNGDGSATVPAPGDWWAVNLNAGNASLLQYTDVHYGGYGSADSGYGAVSVGGTSSAPTLDHADVSYSQRSGVKLLGASNSAVITNSTLTHNAYGVSVNTASVTIDASTITDNSGKGAWFNLPTGYSPPASRITGTEITRNGSVGVYIGANGDYPLNLMPTGSGNNIYANNAGTTQLSVTGYPGFVNASVDWRGNYWGAGVYYRSNQSLCTDTSPHAAGHLAYSANTGNTPAGPIESGYYLVFPDPYTVYYCNWDRFKIDDCEFSSEYMNGTLREVDFAQPKPVADALGCAQQAGVTPVQLESDFSSVCADLRTGYVVGPSETTADITANYGPMTQSLFDELNAFADVSCAYPGSALVTRLRVQASTSGPNGIPIPYASDCHVPSSQWWPSQGKIETGPSWMPGYTGQRRIYQTFKWSAATIAAIQECGADDHNITYEPDAVFDNYDGLHYFGDKKSWASNLPRKYNDTRYSDSENTPTYTVGSADALQLVASKTYFTLIRAAPGNTTTDRGTLVGQIGMRIPKPCYSTWCVFSNASRILVPAWDVPVPGVLSWTG